MKGFFKNEKINFISWTEVNLKFLEIGVRRITPR